MAVQTSVLMTVHTSVLMTVQTSVLMTVQTKCSNDMYILMCTYKCTYCTDY